MNLKELEQYGKTFQKVIFQIWGVYNKLKWLRVLSSDKLQDIPELPPRGGASFESPCIECGGQ